jgi:hypothetical protein
MNLQEELFDYRYPNGFTEKTKTLMDKTRGYLRDIGKKIGILPHVEFGQVEEPVYADSEDKEFLGKLYKQAASGIKNYFGRLFGTEPYFGDVGLEIRRLPTYIFISNGKIVGVSAILGMYDESIDRVSINPAIIPGMQSSLDKKLFKDIDPKRIVIEEFVHAAQDKYGVMKDAALKYRDKATPYLEGMAAWISDKIWGKASDFYQDLKKGYQGLVNRVGEKRAFAGTY